jgi:hypothetical protein
MSKPKNKARASDLGDALSSGTTGFTVRKRTGVGLFFHMFLLVCLVILGAALLVYYQSPQGCALAVAIGLSLALVAQNLERIKKVKQSLEFMNALFSSALGRGYLFCFVVKATGEIVFYNRPFQAIFPAYVAQEKRSIDLLFDLYNLPQDHREKIKAFVSSATEGSIATTLREAEATTEQAMTFYLEPIERPTGFVLVRGK